MISMKMWYTFVCVLAALPSSPTASKQKLQQPITDADNYHPPMETIPQWSQLPPSKEEKRDTALSGLGGGLDELEANSKEKEPLYRPWKKRFDLQPFDVNSPDFLRPENRMSYRRFYAANPNLALAPNSRDRQAQTTVELMFGLTALATIVCGILVVNGFQVLDAGSMDISSYQKLMFNVILFLAAPWVILGVWLLTLFAAGMANPMRDPHTMTYHWQCSAMAWFLLVAAFVNTAYFTVHGLWMSKMFYAFEAQPSAPMGRMLLGPAEKEISGDKLIGFINKITNRFVRILLTLAELLLAVFGYLLLTFRWGANSQLCQPEVYWATNALLITAVVVIAFSFLSFIFTVVIGAYSTSPWLQDFFGSFSDARVLARMKREEERQSQEDIAWKQSKADEKANPGIEYYQHYDELQKDFEEVRTRHEAIMAGHSNYLQAVSQPHPGQTPRPRPQSEEEEEPLIVWRDEVGVPLMTQSAPRLILPPSQSGSYVGNPYNNDMQRPMSMPIITSARQQWINTSSSHQLLPAPIISMPATTSTIYTPQAAQVNNYVNRI